jgi:hypothetical protein
MTTKLQINQSIKVHHDALTIHLNSFKQDNSLKDDNPKAFDYSLRKDGFGIYYFYLEFSECSSYWYSRDANLGFVRLRSLDSKLTEMIIEDSVWVERGPDSIRIEWDFDDQTPHKAQVKARKKAVAAVFDRLLIIHSEVREYILERLEEDRLQLEGKRKRNLKTSHTSALDSTVHTRVFINYAHEDIENARKIYRQLKEIEGISPWFDKESLLPGVTWRPAIKKAIREADFFVALLSKRSVNKRGFVQTEMKEALEIWSQFPEGRAYLLPVRLEECEPSYEKLRDVQIQDLFPNWDRGFQRILQVINTVTRPETSSHAVRPAGYEYRCAIVDLDNGLANLSQICQRLNSIQKFFHFAFPGFSGKHKALRTLDGAANLYVPALSKSFYQQKEYLNSDLITFLTKHLLAFHDDGLTYFHHLSGESERDKTFRFISTHRLYEFTKQAACTFEKGMIYHILSQLLVYFAANLGFHTEVRGCVLDYCKDHSWMVKGLKKMRLCPSCSEAIENKDLKKAVLAILADPLKV